MCLKKLNHNNNNQSSLKTIEVPALGVVKLSTSDIDDGILMAMNVCSPM